MMPVAEHSRTLQRWLRSQGARFPALEVGRDPALGRAVFARRRLAPGEVVLSVPLRSLGTETVAHRSPIIQQLVASQVPLQSRHSLLAVWLLTQRRPDARWSTYVDDLPKSRMHLPLCFDEATLSLLRGTWLLEQLQLRREGLQSDDRLMRAVSPAFRRLSRASFAWASAMCWSRSFLLEMQGVQVAALVPFADLLNHDASSLIHWRYDDARGVFEMAVGREHQPGEQVYNNYGTKIPAWDFMNYGLVPEDGSADEARLVLDGSLPESDREHVVPADGAHEKTRRLFACLRQAAQAKVGWALTNRKRDLLALELLRHACDAALARFDATMEEDDVLLADDTLVPTARACVLMRRKEKRVLHTFRTLARGAIRWLQAPADYLWPPLTKDIRDQFQEFLSSLAG